MDFLKNENWFRTLQKVTSIYKSYLQSDHEQPISIIPNQNIDLSGSSCLYLWEIRNQYVTSSFNYYLNRGRREGGSGVGSDGRWGEC